MLKDGLLLKVAQMDSELLEQRKEYLRYNQDRNDLMRSLCEPLKMYFNAEWFARVTLL